MLRQHLPGLGRAGRRRHRRPRPLGDVAHREQVEADLVVRLLGRRRRRQDDVRVARRLVDVEVDRDEEVEAGERALELRRSSRRCAPGWSSAGSSRAPGPSPGVSISSAIVEDGISPLDLGLAARRGSSSARSRSPCPSAARRRSAPPGVVNIDAARAVEIAGEDVHEVAAPARQRAELLHAGAEPAVAGGRLAPRPARARCAGSRRPAMPQ